ncbi:MAG: hypothetical protein Q8908_07755 [Bacteroidota bacterium]|nr:hypothetical protein [Bacteroidota bacterium]
MQYAYNKYRKTNIRLEVDNLFYKILTGIQDSTKLATGKRVALSGIILHFCEIGIEKEAISSEIMYKKGTNDVQKTNELHQLKVNSERICSFCTAFEHERIKASNLEDEMTDSKEKIEALQNDLTLKEDKINCQSRENLNEKEKLLQLKEEILNKVNRDVQQMQEIELLKIKLEHANERFKLLSNDNQNLKDTNREQYNKIIQLLERIDRSTR